MTVYLQYYLWSPYYNSMMSASLLQSYQISTESLGCKVFTTLLPDIYNFATKYLQNPYGIYRIPTVSTHLWYLQNCCQILITLLPNIYRIPIVSAHLWYLQIYYHISMVSTNMLSYIYESLWYLQPSTITIASTGISRICWWPLINVTLCMSLSLVCWSRDRGLQVTGLHVMETEQITWAALIDL